MPARRPRLRFWLILVGAVLAVLGIAADIWRDDIVKALLDPKVPFGKDHPPPAPNYALRGAWALAPDGNDPARATVDVFFIHPTSYPASFTSYNGGRHWNAPFNDHGAGVVLARVM